MESGLRALVEAIHASPTRAVLIISGGASQAVGWLLSVPGASNTVLEVTVPYSRRSMIQILGQNPSQFVSRSTAHAIALAAYNRALRLSPPGLPVIGISFTGALASDSPKKGEHRCFVTTRSQGALWEYSLTLQKGLRDRFSEDALSSQLLLQALADASGVREEVNMELTASERLEKGTSIASPEQQLEQLLNGEVSMVTFQGPQIAAKSNCRRVVLPGSFNPLHDGHLALMSAACSEIRNGVACFEISAVNVDKPSLAVPEILRRVRQFQDSGLMVVVTNQPLFYRKAELLPDSSIVIGYDTAIRLINPKYYGGSRENMIRELKGIKNHGCDFLVAGRVVDGVFHEMADVEIPEELIDMFQCIPGSKFRMDISSTELRAKLANRT